jgi:putative ABC transport system ATP-binding protein
MEIEISRLAFEYPNRSFRLRIAGLRIESGSSVALVGPSGSGKSTLLRLLAGIHVPTSGELRRDSVALSSLGETARRQFRLTRIGFVFQDFQLIEYLDVEENIRLPCRLQPAAEWTPRRARRLRELAASTGIAARMGDFIDELSHGEKQRVAICRALLTEPRLILADEPTGNLDPANKRRIVELLFAEAHKLAATLIVVTHDREVLAGFHRVIDFQSLHTA